MPRYDYENEFEGIDPHSTMGEPDDNTVVSRFQQQ
jgi:hypothetical protein